LIISKENNVQKIKIDDDLEKLKHRLELGYGPNISKNIEIL